MTLWYVLSLPAILVVFLTAVARLDDIDRTKRGWYWNMRRLGLFGCAIYAILLAATPFTESGKELQMTWVTAIGINGWAAAWVFTPPSPQGTPPWHMLITGEYRQHGIEFKTLRERILHEIAGLWWSFKHRSAADRWKDRTQRKDAE